jgi:hypothetical protein
MMNPRLLIRSPRRARASHGRAHVETIQASHRGRDSVAADRDGGRFERAILLLVGGGNEDFWQSPWQTTLRSPP